MSTIHNSFVQSSFTVYTYTGSEVRSERENHSVDIPPFYVNGIFNVDSIKEL